MLKRLVNSLRSRPPIRPVVITMRYSVLTSGAKAWVISRDRDAEDYKRALFADARLDSHHYLFENVALASLRAQTPKLSANSFRLFVITSTELPSRHRAKLDASLSNIPWVEVVAVAPDHKVRHSDYVKKFLRNIDAVGLPHAHCRLDDDDGLAVDFVARLRDLIRPEFDDMGVSFGSGYAALLDRDLCIDSIKEYYYPKIALGLAHVGGRKTADAYSMGNHTKIDTRRRTLLDSREPAFIRSMHLSADTSGLNTKFGPDVSASEVLTRFPFVAALEDVRRPHAIEMR